MKKPSKHIWKFHSIGRLSFALVWLFVPLAAAAAPPATAPSAAQSAAPATLPGGWKLAWDDEFSGDAIDRARWTFDLGNGFVIPKTHQFIGGWGNGEMEYYTSRPENSFVKDGVLHIRAIAESYHGCKYTSARLTSKGLFSQTYGRFEFRAKLPAGRGLWPALWLMPADNAYGGWAASGEIDIMEARGQNPSQVLGTLHYGSAWPGEASSGAKYELPDGGSIADFHIYTLEWEPGVVRWYVDGKLYSTKRNWWSCSKLNAKGQGEGNPPEGDRNAWPAPFDKPFFIIMDLAVGGQFVGKPDGQRQFPQEMLVDYVRVYAKSDYGRVLPAETARDTKGSTLLTRAAR